jgi:hypothetical protein
MVISKRMMCLLTLSFTAAGLQAFPLRNIKLEPIEAAETKRELIEILKLIDKEPFTNEKSYIGKVIGHDGGPSYRIIELGWIIGEDQINQGLKQITLWVDLDERPKQGEKIYAGNKNKWYLVDYACKDYTGHHKFKVNLIEHTYQPIPERYIESE